MQRQVRIVHLKPEDEAEYIRYHAEVWPTVLATIERCHIRNYTIFLRGDLLVAYFEYHGTDLAADLALMAEDPETQRWWRITEPMQRPMADAPPGELWSSMREVFHVD